MRKYRQIVITALFSIVAFIVLFFFSIKPLQNQVKKFRVEHAEVAELLATSRGYIAKYKNVKSAFTTISAQWEALSSYLPDEKEMPDLLKEIASAGKSSNVVFLLFKPLDTGDTGDFYKENPIQLRVKCNYHELGNFLSKIADMKRLVNVNKLALATPKKQDKSAGSIAEKYMEADFIATAYTTFFKKPVEMPAEKPAAKLVEKPAKKLD